MITACTDLDPFFDGELSRAQADDFRAHLATCAHCQGALHGRMQEAMALDVHHDRRPPGALARRRRRWRTVLAAALPAAAAAVTVVALVRPTGAPPHVPPLAVAMTIQPRGPAMRGTSTAHPGDLLHISATGAVHRAIWVYRNEKTLVATCPGSAGCRLAPNELTLELPLDARGTYAVVTLGAAATIPTPRGTLDDDVAAASMIEGSYQIGHVEVD
jgi:hypothetical protein